MAKSKSIIRQSVRTLIDTLIAPLYPVVINAVKSVLGIGIPKYRNDDKFLLSLSSAISQNSERTSIVITDNNPAASSILLQAEFRPANLKYFANPTNLGAIKNFIRSWELSNSRYFTWLSDDDLLSPGFTDYMLNQIDCSSKDVIAWAGIPASFCSSEPIQKLGRISPSLAGSPLNRVFKTWIFGKYNFPFYSVFDRKYVSIKPLSMISSLWPGPLDAIDWGFSTYLAILGSVKVLPRYLYLYRADNWVTHENMPDLSIPYRNNWNQSSLNSSHSDPIDVRELVTVIHANRLLTCYALNLLGLDDAISKGRVDILSLEYRSVTSKLLRTLYTFLMRPHSSLHSSPFGFISNQKYSIIELLLTFARYIDHRCCFSRTIEDGLLSVISEIKSEGLIDSIIRKEYHPLISILSNTVLDESSRKFIKYTTFASEILLRPSQSTNSR